ncbi:MAG: hypothetical protein L6R42_007141 [Xanthoria sp. 1 TBL-2021]|nr:MAG: hypothetical protein L6R42_007141 [Xanthoria sp. 1 TBL-2021]
MNHLPWPRNDEIPPLEIPYVCHDVPDFDGLDFLEYPFRCGWSTPEDKFRWIHAPPSVTGKRAQNWLFFGLLQVFLGRWFDKDDFIAQSHQFENGRLDTTLLPLRCSDLVRSVHHDGRASNGALSHAALKARWNSAYMEAKLHLEFLDMHMNMETDERLRLVTAPMPILLQSLGRVANEVFWRRDEDSPPMCVADPLPGKLALWQMLDLKWCKAQVRSLYHLYSPFLNHYLSGLPRRHLNSHDRGCSWESCVANNVNEESYKTHHTRESCCCQFIGPDPRRIAELIYENRIPLVKLHMDAGQPKLDIVAAESNTKYASLSHVWAGGLGNFKENKLPTCQLSKLYGQLSELDRFRPPKPKLPLYKVPQWAEKYLQYYSQVESAIAKITVMIQLARRRCRSLAGLGEPEAVCFWMDTLCIPVHPDDKPLRMKAINNMNLTYAAAERCLVLDPELQQISMKELTLTQLNAHVLCCTWLTRSWTFQEARLSRAWYAQFEDGLYDPNSQANASLHYHLYSEWNIYKSDAHNLDSEMISWYNNMPAMRQTDIIDSQASRFIHDDLYNFIMIWNHLVSRSTSKKEDVNSILANTLDLSAGQILALPSQQRMKAVFKAQKRLPAGLLFNTANKIDDPSCRWVPWYPEQTLLSYAYGVLTPTQDGFLFESVGKEGYPVGFLVSPSVPRHQKIRLVDPSDSSNVMWIKSNQEPKGPATNWKAPSDLPTIAVMYLIGDLRTSLQQQSVVCRHAGARFAVRRREGRTWHLVYEYSFFYSHMKRWYHDEGEETYHTIHVEERTDEDAEFHIDSELSTWPLLTYHRDTTSSLTSHGLHFYIIFGMSYLFLVWTPFYYLSLLLTHPPHLLLSTTALIVRVIIACFELWHLRDEISEHAYKSWVKTFDETGSFRKHEGMDEKKEDWKIHLALGLGTGIVAIAALVPGMGYLCWIAMAVVVEPVGLWVVRRVWRRKGIRRLVKGWLKGRGWW